MTGKSPGSRKQTDREQDREKARKIAKKHIEDCKDEGETPRIYKAVELITEEGRLSREYRGKNTIRDWIKKISLKRAAGNGRAALKSSDEVVCVNTWKD